MSSKIRIAPKQILSIGRRGFLVFGVIILITIASCSSDYQPSVPEISVLGMEPQVAAKITQLRENVKANPKDEVLWGRLAMNLYAHELLPEAAFCFEQASKMNPKEFRWPYFCAIALHNLGKHESLDWYHKAVTLQPDNPQLHVRMSNGYLIEGNNKDATKHFQKAITLDERRADAYVGLAQIDYNLERFSEAVERLEKAISIEPNLRQAHALLISCYRMQWEQHKVMEAVKRLQQLEGESSFGDPILYEIANEGVSFQWCMERGEDYLEAQQPDAAITEFRHALEIRPVASAYSQLGIALMNSGKPDEAISHFRTAHELNPESAQISFNFGLALCNNGYTSEGITILEQAHRQIPEEERYSAVLIEQYVRDGQWSEAVKLGNRIYDANPNNLSMGLDLVWILSTCPRDKVRNGPKAVRIAESIANKMNRNPDTLDCLAAAYAENGQYALAAV